MKHARYVGHVLYGNANQSKREHFYEHYMIFLIPQYSWRLYFFGSDYYTAVNMHFISVLNPRILIKKCPHFFCFFIKAFFSLVCSKSFLFKCYLCRPNISNRKCWGWGTQRRQGVPPRPSNPDPPFLRQKSFFLPPWLRQETLFDDTYIMALGLIHFTRKESVILNFNEL